MDFKNFFKLILFKQTIFALPFALLGLIFAGGADKKIWILVAIALTAARAAGMSFNMAIDAKIDAKNPRTKERLIPMGEVKLSEAWAAALISSLVLIAVSFFLNRLCFYLSFGAVLFLFTYSFFKRFSASSHFYLGFIEAAAPIGGYLAVAGAFSVVPFALGAVILTWISGLDIVYALQDMEFDRKEKLHSIPALLGKKKALLISALCYIASFSGIVFVGLHTDKHFPYWIFAFFVALIFFRQQTIAWKSDAVVKMKRIFKINMYIAPALFLGTFLDMLLAG